MMKTLKKSQISELKKEMPMLDRKELESIIGGHRYYFDSHGQLINTVSDDQVNIVMVNDAYYSLSGNIILGINGFHGSGWVLQGSGVTSGLFKFLANNTDVEWLYVYNSGSAGGGCLITSNLPDKVHDKLNLANSHDSTVHNHYQDIGVYSGNELYINLFSHPSNGDIQKLIDNNHSCGYIYNELDHSWHYYDRGTQTQEDYAEEHHIQLNN